MVASFLAKNPDAPIAGFVGIGMRNNGEYELNALRNLQQVKVPVLDIYGDGGNRKDLKHARERQVLLSGRYTQVLVPGVDHRFSSEGMETQLIREVTNWLIKNDNEKKPGHSVPVFLQR